MFIYLFTLVVTDDNGHIGPRVVETFILDLFIEIALLGVRDRSTSLIYRERLRFRNKMKFYLMAFDH